MARLEREDNEARPVVSFLTPGAGYLQPWRGMAMALAKGFDEIGVPFDAVFLVGEPSARAIGPSSREVHLGVRHVRGSVGRLHQYLRRTTPAISLVTPTFWAPLAILAGRLARCTVVPWEQGFSAFDMEDVSSLRYRVAPGLQRLSYPFASAIFANSTDTASHLERYVLKSHRFSEQIFLLPNPVDPNHILALSREANGEPPLQADFVICAVGRLARQKGYDTLLDALSLARARLPSNWRLLILGEGPRRQELERQMDRLGLTSHVSLLGYVENPYPLMSHSDLFVHAARYEPFGQVLTEALALGLPILATACAGAPQEILEGGDAGVLVPPEDPRAMAEELVRLSGDASLRERLARSARPRAEVYSPSVIAKEILVLLDTLKKRNP
jgi:glycosyltransferase involved in cell wall biosynthesis